MKFWIPGENLSKTFGNMSIVTVFYITNTNLQQSDYITSNVVKLILFILFKFTLHG